MIEIPEGKALANGHIYKVHFDAGVKRPSDEQVAQALSDLGAVKVEHTMNGGTQVVVTKNNTKENA